MVKDTETIIQVVKCYQANTGGSIVVIIPKKLGIEPGTEFLVKQDDAGRLIYEATAKEAS